MNTEALLDTIDSLETRIAELEEENDRARAGVARVKRQRRSVEEERALMQIGAAAIHVYKGRSFIEVVGALRDYYENFDPSTLAEE